MTETIPLKLKLLICYKRTKQGVWFYTEHNFKVFIPNKIFDRVKQHKEW